MFVAGLLLSFVCFLVEFYLNVFVYVYYKFPLSGVGAIYTILHLNLILHRRALNFGRFLLGNKNK